LFLLTTFKKNPWKTSHHPKDSKNNFTTSGMPKPQKTKGYEKCVMQKEGDNLRFQWK
jgi:hypothetical protein